MKKTLVKVFDIVGLSTLIVSCGLTLMTFILIAYGGPVTFREPNAYVLGAEIALFGFTFLYSIYRFKVGINNLVKKMVWEKLKREFYAEN